MLRELAREQAGVISRAQAVESGLTRHVIDRLRASGSWQVLGPGVYWTHRVPTSWLGRAWAGVLIGGPESALAGRAAAVLHGLAEGEPLPIRILVPHGTRLVDRPWVRFQRQRDNVRMRVTPALPPRSPVEDTVLDLCAEGEPADVVSWVTTAVQRRLTSPARLLAALRARRAIQHRKLIEEILDDAQSGVHSPLEYRFGRDVLRSHGLPPGRRQFRIVRTKRLADVAYEEFRLLVELDGRIGHVEGGMWRDRKRDNAHAVAGWLTLRFGWRELVQEPCAVAADIAGVLRDRGWTGRLRTCPACGEIRTA